MRHIYISVNSCWRITWFKNWCAIIVLQMVGLNGRKIIFLQNMGVGFGDLTATAENLPPESGEQKLHEYEDFMMKAASNCCVELRDRFCCLCCIQACSQLNDRCAVAFTQLCTALACFECLKCCCELCDSCDQCCWYIGK